MKSKSGRVLVHNSIIEATETILVNFSKYSGPLIDVFPFTLLLCNSLTFFKWCYSNYFTWLTTTQVKLIRWNTKFTKTKKNNLSRSLLHAPIFIGEGECIPWNLIQLLLFYSITDVTKSRWNWNKSTVTWNTLYFFLEG